MIHVHFDDEPTSSAHWAVGFQRERRRILVQISNRAGHQVRLPLDLPEARTFAESLAVLRQAAPVLTIRSRELGEPGSTVPSHWAAYSLAGGVRIDLCAEGDFAAAVIPNDSLALLSGRILALVPDITTAGEEA